MIVTLRFLLALLGVSAVAIAASIVLTGAQYTAWTAEKIFAALTGWQGPLSEPWPPTMDNELRFYAVLWGAYGVVAIWVARDLDARRALVPVLAGIFFLGGIGRLLSILAVGSPHPFFILLMWIELLMPVAMVLLWWRLQRR